MADLLFPCCKTTCTSPHGEKADMLILRVLEVDSVKIDVIISTEGSSERTVWLTTDHHCELRTYDNNLRVPESKYQR